MIMIPNNRPKISVFIAISIDGFIAKENGDIDRLTNFNLPTSENQDKDCGFSKFFSASLFKRLGAIAYDLVKY